MNTVTHNISKLAFCSKSKEIRNTGFEARTQSKKYYAPENSKKVSALTRSIGEAIATVAKGIEIYKVLRNRDNIYIEYGGDNKHYQAIIDLNLEIINISWDLDSPLLNSNYVTRGTILPVVVADYILNKSDFKDNIDALRNLNLFDTDNEEVREHFFLAHDKFYFTHKDVYYQYFEEDKISIDLNKYNEDLTNLFVDSNSVEEEVSNLEIPTMKGFTDEQLKKVPKLEDFYKLPEEYLDTAISVAYGDTLSTILFGPAGNGKSTSCKLICQEINLPLIDTLSFTGNVDELILGKFVPNSDSTDNDTLLSELNLVKEKSSQVFEEMITVAMTKYKKADEPIRDEKIADLKSKYSQLQDRERELTSQITSSENSSKYKFIKPPIIDAIQNGGAVVIEEINMAKPQYIAFLNSLLDDNAFVTLDNGEKIHRHPNFRLFATMNPEYGGTSDINLSLWDRFDEKIYVEELPEKALLNNLLKKVKINNVVAQKMIKVYSSLREKIKEEDLDSVFSIRGLENWAKKYNILKDPIKAAEKTVIMAIAKKDEDLTNEILDILNTEFPKSFKR